MTIRKPVPSPQSFKYESTTCTAPLTLLPKPTLALAINGSSSHCPDSQDKGRQSCEEDGIPAEKLGFDGQVNRSVASHSRVANAEPTSDGEVHETAGPLLHIDQGLITPRTSDESQRSNISENAPSIAIPLSVAHLVPDVKYAPSSRNPFRRTKSSPQILDQSQAETQSSAEMWSGKGTAHTDDKAHATLIRPSQLTPEIGTLSIPATSQPQSGVLYTFPNQNIGNVSSTTDHQAYSNGLKDQPRYQHTMAPEEGNARAIDLSELDANNTESVSSIATEAMANLVVSPTLKDPPFGSEPNSPPPTSQDPILQTSSQPLAETDATPKTQPLTEHLSKAKRTSETYEIRLIAWCDALSTSNPRTSPIMMQNANGPCPLLALVNALVLSTPSNIKTPLVETLRLREQISLGLLLDAVIDELMSGRRGDAARALPDVSELYAFLLTLHTGMSINPCFVRSEENAMSLLDAPINEETNLPDLRRPGTFEDTREMKLYSTFGVPLIHGWIPPETHPAFESLKRAARTYEDAQNILFKEDELEEKLKSHGLNQDEQVMLEDIGSVKYFLSSTATQLTAYGLDTITETLTPGTIAILFRNDHFSTLYRHPKSGQLLNLVTDMGYAGHEEVVWESLVDVSGEGSGFFAGDFRPVGHVAGDTRQQSGHAGQVGHGRWEAVGQQAGNHDRKNQHPTAPAPQASSNVPPLDGLGFEDRRPALSSSTEQEDHDLALAMQLQEEEEERARREQAARRRENELSQAYLDNADAQGRRTFPGFGRGAQGRPKVPPRGGSSTNTNSRSTPSARQAPRKQSSSEDAPPPSYEQAAQGPAYHPPVSHPAHPHAASLGPGGNPLRPPGGRMPQGSSAYSQQASASGESPLMQTPSRRKAGKGRHIPRLDQLEDAPGVVRRRTDIVGSAISEDGRKEKECIVM
ncbi:MAG: hypothetical protein Q9163_005992 [Psora crenata]